jgi:penicillin-binding protein 1A
MKLIPFQIELQSGKYQNFIAKVWKYAKYGFLGFVLYMVSVNFNFFWLFGRMPSLEELENPKSQLASTIYSTDGKELGRFFYENRSEIEFSELSPYIHDALVATEDVRFYRHSGIDARSMFRVVAGLLTGQSGRTGGGSTITQQLAKNLFKLREDDYYKGPLGRIPVMGKVIGKTKEWITAVKLERRYSKQEIMKMYLNTIEFSSGAYGIKSACKTYFGKQPHEVSVEEAAMLVGMIQNPSRFNPKFHPVNSRARRDVVFDQMVKYTKLTSEQAEKLKAKAIVLKYQPESHNTGPAPYFREFLKDWLKKEIKELGYEPSDIYTKGFKVYTTLDFRMQRYAEESMKDNMSEQQKLFNAHWKGQNPWVTEIEDSGRYKEIPGFLETMAKRTGRYQELKKLHDGDETKIWKDMKKRHKMTVFTWAGERDTLISSMDSIAYYKRFLQSGLLSIDPRNGYIKAWVGGINYKYFKYDHVFQGKRQPGSTFKPFVYATAIDNGFSTCQTVVDQPITFGSEDGVYGKTWTPKNAEGGYSGRAYTLREALGRSVNTVSATLIKQFKAKTVAKYAHQLGIKSDLDEIPALCLGVSNVSLYELLSGYGVFVNGGKYTEPIFVTRIEDKNGNLIKDYLPNQKEVLSQETSYKMLHLLRGATSPGGTAYGGLIRYGVLDGNEVAAKTGTTSNYSDGWFVAATQNLVTGVWTGGDEPAIHFRTIALGQGARVALPAVGGYLKRIYADATLKESYPRTSFIKPSTISISGDCVFAQGEGYYIDSSQRYTPPTAKPIDDEQLVP